MSLCRSVRLRCRFQGGWRLAGGRQGIGPQSQTASGAGWKAVDCLSAQEQMMSGCVDVNVDMSSKHMLGPSSSPSARRRPQRGQTADAASDACGPVRAATSCTLKLDCHLRLEPGGAGSTQARILHIARFGSCPLAENAGTAQMPPLRADGRQCRRWY